jgi:pimeloyl-ACP methyl ester carboxylesterase
MLALEKALAAAEAAGIKQKHVQVGDLRFNVARFGRGIPLLLLHGWPEFWLVWRPIMEQLGQDFELIAPDLGAAGKRGRRPLHPIRLRLRIDTHRTCSASWIC